MDSKLADLIVGGCHNPPALGQPADQGWVIALLDGSIERVHIDVHDHGSETWETAALPLAIATGQSPSMAGGIAPWWIVIVDLFQPLWSVVG